MGDHGSSDVLETHDGKRQKSGRDRDRDLDQQGLARASHHGKQHMISGNDDEHGWRKGSIVTETNKGCKADHSQREYKTDQIFHSHPTNSRFSRCI
jgi:hypothetical protein